MGMRFLVISVHLVVRAVGTVVRKLGRNLSPSNVIKEILTQRVCSCWNKLPSNVIGAGTLSEFKSRLIAHFAISPLIYDHRATWDSREGLDAWSLHAGAAGS